MGETLLARSALRPEGAFADLAAWRKVLARGGDARSWLGDLVTADVAGLEPGRAVRALLLSPTGRIRADLTVAGLEDGFLLLQHPGQPRSAADLLAPYRLSSDVELVDRTGDLGVVAFPGDDVPPRAPGARSAPSCLGRGADLVLQGGTQPIRRAAEAAGLREASAEDLEGWRVERGAARFPVDLSEASLPHEAALDRLVDVEKGCFLGQEAVAKVRNLGHPPWLVLAGGVAGTARPGETVRAEDRDVGEVTSAALVEGGTAVIVRVRWEARDLPLRTASGAPVEVSGPATGPS